MEIEEYAKYAGLADNITAFFVASIAISVLLRAWYTRTIGSRSPAARKLRSITPGNPVAYVESLFGVPIFVYDAEHLGTADEKLEVRLYNALHGWLTVSYSGGRVEIIGFTQTDRKFKFDITVFSRGVYNGVLGKTSYTDIEETSPTDYVLDDLPSGWIYSEVRWAGQTAHFDQHYALGNTSYGRSSLKMGRPNSLGEDGDEPQERARQLAIFRSRNAPDTICVYGAGAHGRQRFTGGVLDYMDVRKLEGNGPRGWIGRQEYYTQQSSRWNRIRRRLGA